MIQDAVLICHSFVLSPSSRVVLPVSVEEVRPILISGSDFKQMSHGCFDRPAHFLPSLAGDGTLFVHSSWGLCLSSPPFSRSIK